MDINRSENDLSEMERRLASWRPGVEGLDADAMLFAAGVAAGRTGLTRFVIPAFCGGLIVLSALLGIWAMTERAERLLLASRPRERDTTSNVERWAALPVPSYAPSPDDYFHMRRQMEQDPNRWIASAPISPSPAPAPEPVIFKFGQRDILFDQ